MRAIIPSLLAIALATIAPLVANDREVGSGRGPQNAADDGWRRTATGWERRDWPEPRNTIAAGRHASVERQPARFDCHPAGLALLQILAIALAFVAFPLRQPAGSGARRFAMGVKPPWHSPAWIY